MAKYLVTVPEVEVEAETHEEAVEMALDAIYNAVMMGKQPEATLARPESFEPVGGQRFYTVERGVMAVVAVPADADRFAIRIAACDEVDEDFSDADITEISREEYLNEGGEEEVENA